MEALLEMLRKELAPSPAPSPEGRHAHDQRLSSVDVRLIAATNEDLEEAIRAGVSGQTSADTEAVNLLEGLQRFSRVAYEPSLASLEDRSEFRIGAHELLFVMTEREGPLQAIG